MLLQNSPRFVSKWQFGVPEPAGSCHRHRERLRQYRFWLFRVSGGVTMTSRSSVTFAIPRLLAPLLMLFLALVGLLPRIARAQATASINGTVYDTSGAVGIRHIWGSSPRRRCRPAPQVYESEPDGIDKQRWCLCHSGCAARRL